MIAGMALLWYGLVPMLGAVRKRRQWYKFRIRFDRLRLSPVLDYRSYLQNETGTFTFTGNLESTADGQNLWIRNENLTVPVLLKNTETWLLSGQNDTLLQSTDNRGEDTFERIRWGKTSLLNEGIKVFAGGSLACVNGLKSFVSSRENPLTVIFFDDSEDCLASRVIRTGRPIQEYWNSITPYSLIAGALCQIIIAISFLHRPAFRLTVIVSLIAMLIPLFVIIPPGLVFTVLYRRLVWKSRNYLIYSDLARLPLYLELPRQSAHAAINPIQQSRGLPNGQLYGFSLCNELPPEATDGKIPLLLPESIKAKKGEPWYMFGVIQPDSLQTGSLLPGSTLPTRPEDPLAVYGFVPGNPQTLSYNFAVKAHLLEVAAWIVLLAGVGLNIFFVRIVLALI